MLHRFKLGAKIFASFALVLLLLISMAGFNFLVLNGIIRRVQLSGDINKLVTHINTARQQEKNFIIQGDSQSSSRVLQEMKQFRAQSKAIRSRYTNSEVLTEIDRMQSKADQYLTAFQDTMKLTAAKGKMRQEMNQKAAIALKQTAGIRDEQKKQLEKIRQNSQTQFSRKLELVNEANTINNTAIEGKVFRFAIVNQEDLSRMVEWEGNNKKLQTQVKKLKSQFKEPDNIKLADKVLKQHENYKKVVLQYIDDKSDDNLDTMIKGVKGFMWAISSLQFDLKEQLEFLQEDTRTLIDEKLAITEDAEHIATWFQDTRLKEKEFVITRNPEYVQATLSLSDTILKNTDALKEKIKTPAEQSQAANIRKAVSAYRTSFQQYADLTRQQEQADAKMIQSALAVEKVCNTVRGDLKEIMGTQIDRSKLMLICGAGVALLLGFILAYRITRAVARPIRSLALEAGRLAVGNIDMPDAERDFVQKLTKRGDEIGDISKAFSSLIEYVQEKVSVSHEIASGNLNVDIGLRSQEDQLGLALKKMAVSLNEVIAHLYNAADQVDAGSSQVSASSQSLASGATQQASSLEQINASMTEITNQTKTNAENSNQVDQLVTESRSISQNGVQQMETLMNAIGAISEASKEIDKIIKVIDGIAFQTNLLALNAAVEAARAGKHGKGFAVVAQEVRGLAARSAKAAQETASLIQAAVKRVEDGNQIAHTTAEALTHINDGITKVADLVKEIAISSNEQAHGISQITQGLAQIDDVTQQNTACAEETSAEAEELSSQAALVRRLLTRFTIQRAAATGKSAPRLLTR